MTSCCFPACGVLTRTERAAIARLREQRAQGRVPPTAAHAAAVTPRPDPLVTFYSRPPVPAPPSSTSAVPRRLTAHQLKKEAAARRRAGYARENVRHPRPRPRPRPALRPMDPFFTHAPQSIDASLVSDNPPAAAGTATQSEDSASERPAKHAALLDAAKPLSLWHALKGGLRGRAVKSESQAASTSDGKEPESEGKEAESDGKENASSRLRNGVRRKWDDIVLRLGGNPVKGERFVLQERPEPSDFAESNTSDIAESNNDRYFQELMTADS